MKGLHLFVNESEEMTTFERDAFNAAMQSGDPARVFPALREMRERHRSVTGYEPEQVVIATSGGAVARVQPFADLNEARAAFADLRFGKVPAYTAEVQARGRISACLDTTVTPDGSL